MGQPAARLTDLHVCPMVTGVVPHVGGPVAGPGAPTVLVGALPAARVTDMVACMGPPDLIAKGSATVLISGLPAARMGDLTAHGGSLVIGLPTVLIGDAASSGGGAGGGGAGGGGGGAGGGSGGGGGGGAPRTSSSASDVQDVFGHLLSTAPAMSAPVVQARTLVQAAKKGAAFCQRCHAGR